MADEGDLDLDHDPTPGSRSSPARHNRFIAPRHRVKRASIQPTVAEPTFPIGDYMTPASDSLGRNVNLSVTMAPLTRRAASIMVARNLFGFETEQDVWRYCISHGLDDLRRQAEDEEVTSAMAMLNSFLIQARTELELMYYQQVLEQHRLAVERLIQGGHPIKALQIAENVWHQHDKIENQYWRQVYRSLAKEMLDLARESVRADQARARKKAERLEFQAAKKARARAGGRS